MQAREHYTHPQSERLHGLGRILITGGASLMVGGLITYLNISLPPGNAVADPLIMGLAILTLIVVGLALYAERCWLVSLPVLVGLAFLGYPLGALSYALGWVEPTDAQIPVFSAHLQNHIYLVYALLLVLGGFMAWLSGYYLGLGRARTAPKVTPHSATIDRGRLHRVVGAFALVGLVGLALYYRGQGGLGNFIDNVALLRVVPVGTFYLSWIALLLPASSLFWLGMDYDRAVRNPWFWGLFATGFIALLSYGNRWAPGGYLLIAALLYYQRQTSWKRATLPLLALAGAVVLLTVGVSAWRTLSMEEGDVQLQAITARALSSLSFQDLLALFVGQRNTTDVDLLAWITHNYSWGNLLWGRSLFDIPLMVVPRTLWPGKPVELGIRLFQEYSGWYNVSNAWHPGMLGELFVNYHVFGVLLGGMLLGVLGGRVEKWRRSHQQEPATGLIYAVFAIKFALMGAIIGFMMPAIEFLVMAIPLCLGARLVTGASNPTRSVFDHAHRH